MTPVGFVDPLALLVTRADRRPIYVTGALHLAPQLSDQAIARFERQQPHATFVNARGRYCGADDWFCRWREEQGRYGGAIVMTGGEATETEPAPCDDPNLPASRGFHVIQLSVLTEIEDLACRVPILWHPVSPWRSALIPRFAIEGLPLASRAEAARLLPASDAEPLRPFFEGHFLFSLPGEVARRVKR